MRPPDVNGPRPSRRTGDRIVKSIATKRALDVTIIEAADNGRCWRCGTPFAETTPEVLARCTALAQAAATDSPLHYADAEVIEGWPGDDPAAALGWAHRRSAGEAGR